MNIPNNSTKTPRPPINAIVQIRYGSGWDYTGRVTAHHPTLPNAFYVEWHKWGNADDQTLNGWEYNPDHCRVLERPVAGQWWPSADTTESDA